MSSTIKTFAFFDLETTSLPYWGNPAKIIELSIIAIPVYNLMNEDFGGDNLRVQHKLSLCINPMKLIDPDSTKITKLTNEMLEYESKFSESTMRLLGEFFAHLQKPICLVAHNGDKFDFKILMQYHKKLKCSVPDDLMCCDSLTVFKEIFDKKSNEISLERVEIEAISGADKKSENSPGQAGITGDDANSSTNVGEEFTIENIDLIFMQNKNETTPKSSTTSNDSNAPTFIKKRKQPSPELSTPSSKNVRRELFPLTSTLSTPNDKSSPASANKQRQSLKLTEIYHHFFSTYPNVSHAAEADVISLIKCVNACKQDFIDIAERTMKRFSDVEA